MLACWRDSGLKWWRRELTPRPSAAAAKCLGMSRRCHDFSPPPHPPLPLFCRQASVSSVTVFFHLLKTIQEVLRMHLFRFQSWSLSDSAALQGCEKTAITHNPTWQVHSWNFHRCHEDENRHCANVGFKDVQITSSSFNLGSGAFHTLGLHLPNAIKALFLTIYCVRGPHLLSRTSRTLQFCFFLQSFIKNFCRLKLATVYTAIES